jgi:hypothetical protein
MRPPVDQAARQHPRLERAPEHLGRRDPVRQDHRVDRAVADVRAHRPKGPLAVIGRTRDTIARNVLDVIADIAPGAIHFNRGAPTCRILGRLVHVIGANDKKAEKVLRGLTLAGAYVDEITVIPEDFWTQLLGRLSVRAHSCSGPPTRTTPRTGCGRTSCSASTSSTCTRSTSARRQPVPVGRVQGRAQAEFTGLWYKRFILGQWVAAEGAIYDMLDEDTHCRPVPEKALWQAAWIGIDYGTSNPTHAVLMVLANDRLWCVAEWQHNGRTKGQLTDAQISARLATWATAALDGASITPTVVLDPSAASLRVQMRSDGWAGLRSADNRVEVGIRTTSSLFGGGKLVVDKEKERCPILWDELCGYVWDDKALEHGDEQPVKTDDHGPDALRYAIMAARPVWRHWLPALAAEDAAA